MLFMTGGNVLSGNWYQVNWRLKTVKIFLMFFSKLFNPLSANPTKWLNTFNQFVGNMPTNCVNVFHHFVILSLKGLSFCLTLYEKIGKILGRLYLQLK